MCKKKKKTKKKNKKKKLKKKKERAHASLKNVIYKMCLEILYLIYIYMYKEELALNNLQWLICHKTQPNQIIYI